MSETIWIRHPDTGLTSEVPRDALPMYRQSGWQPLEGDELDAHQKAEADDLSAAEQRLVDLGREGLRNAGQVPEERPEFAPAEPEEAPASELPAKGAPKSEWEQSARDRKVPEDEIANSTKDQLVALLTGNKE